METQAGRRLFDGLDEAVERALGVERYRTRTASLGLAASGSYSGGSLAEALFERLAFNWAGLSEERRSRSARNLQWREPLCHTRDRNHSPEVTLERALMHACVSLKRHDWTNQIPLVSGLEGQNSHRRRAIDLVRRRDDHSIEFVELKISSDTPLRAAIEIVEYGFLWLLARRDRMSLGLGDSPILTADDLALSVLAPARFYKRVHVPWLEDSLNLGLAAISASAGVRLAFRFTAFPSSFSWPADHDATTMVSFLDGRVRI